MGSISYETALPIKSISVCESSRNNNVGNNSTDVQQQQHLPQATTAASASAATATATASESASITAATVPATATATTAYLVRNVHVQAQRPQLHVNRHL
jgi:hypothetical protein